MTEPQADFSTEVIRLRAEYEQRRVATNMFPPNSRPILEVDVQRGDKSSMTFWYDDGTDRGQCIRVFDVPGTLSGDLLRLYGNLPPVSGHVEVDGDEIRPLDCCLDYPEEEEDDSEDVSDLVARLPLVDVDRAKHFVKKAKYRSEIQNLRKCQGGSVPGTPLSPHIIQLLGRSADGLLVFEKLLPFPAVFSCVSSLSVYKGWLLDLVDALHCLHSLDIVHRDLRISNLLFSHDTKSLFPLGEREAPEVAFEGGLDDSGWSPQSDIYDIGNCVKGWVYANAPITHFVEWPVPPPLMAIVDACMRPRPEERPTLAELRVMVEEIKTK